MDNYKELLEETCTNLERIYKISSPDDNSGDRGITEICMHVAEVLDNLGTHFSNAINLESFDNVTILSHISQRIEFFEHLRVDFRGYPSRDVLVESLMVFTKRKFLNTETKIRAENIIRVLNFIDEKHLKLRYELPYRLLRIFVIMVLHSHYVEASILAKFLLTQLERSE